MAKDNDAKCEVQANIVRRGDGKYSVTITSQGRSEKVTGCEWPEVEQLLGKIQPKVRLYTIGEAGPAPAYWGGYGGSRPVPRGSEHSYSCNSDRPAELCPCKTTKSATS